MGYFSTLLPHLSSVMCPISFLPKYAIHFPSSLLLLMLLSLSRRPLETWQFRELLLFQQIQKEWPLLQEASPDCPKQSYVLVPLGPVRLVCVSVQC